MLASPGAEGAAPALPAALPDALFLFDSPAGRLARRRGNSRFGRLRRARQPWGQAPGAFLQEKCESRWRSRRNPIYLGMGVIVLGVGLLLDSGWVAPVLAGWAALMHGGVILREERYLLRKFGAPYLAYLRKVRRWI